MGRPSTYASILSTIQDRGYVKKEGGKFSPTELGFVVTDLLVKNFDDIFDIKYTARMEGELDDIEDGKIDWRVAMAEFYEKFKVDLVRAEATMEDIKRIEKPTDLICDKCGKPMILRLFSSRQNHSSGRGGALPVKRALLPIIRTQSSRRWLIDRAMSR